jgi:uncharacterized protein
MANRLAGESSPYLLQHQDNPVDWYPWGEEAFARARADDRPIFLSIGYSTCHWCHVMAHESFEDPDIAEVLNRHFVPVKVDREERPDVDRVYMTFVQATTGSGGWPMSVWLTPALEPFYGGTYFPPTGRWGRPGFVQVLEEIARVWREQRDRVVASASDIVDQLRRIQPVGGDAVPGVEVLERATTEFAQAFDRRRGGFGDAPKFPRPSELLFLLREHARTAAAEPRDMAVATLRAMALGGMRDHLGGGFHRYSVDGDWRVPHFEKMLYDQAQLALAYTEAAQVTGESFFADVAADTLAYVCRDLRDPAGGFLSAEDADSVPPEESGTPHPTPREGAFYVWRDAEIGDALGEDAGLVRLRFGIEPGGNAPADPHGEFTGANLLYVARGVDEVAAATGRAPADVERALARARDTLVERRRGRPRPHLDDQVITSWNGLAVAALARAARSLEGLEAHAEDAARAARFVRSHLWDAPARTLRRRYRAGDAGVDGYAEDYACMVFGLLELFQADGNPEWLEWAIDLQAVLDDRFGDRDAGGWYSTTGQDPSVLLRLKEDYDGAEPSASSVATWSLLLLAHLVGDEGQAQVERTLRLIGGRPDRSSRTIPMMLAALSTYHAGVTQVVVSGDPAAPETRALDDVLRRRYRPFLVVVPVRPAHRERLAALLPWTASLPHAGERPAAYVCRAFTCLAPAMTGEALAAQLDAV